MLGLRLENLKVRNAELRAEIERLQAESDISDGLLADAKAEVEQLKAALRLMDEFAWTAVTADCEEARVGLNERLAAVRAALEHKP
jgi:thiamine monophosphate kinase